MSSNEDKKQDVEEQPLKDVKVDNVKKRSFLENIKYVKDNITVEPIFAGLIIGATLSRLAVQNLNLDKSCRVKLDFGDEACDALLEKKGNHTFQEGQVQQIISSIESWKSIVQTAIPTLLVIFMGAWSDRTGNRKLCILMPVFGEFLVCICNIISTFFFKEICIEITMFFEAFFSAITGGWVMVYLGVFSYISDITTPETRTFRVGMANLCLTAGVPVGTALSGILLKWLGYYGVFLLSALIYLSTFIYGCIYLKKKTKPGVDENEKANPVSYKDIVVFIKETAEVAFKPRNGNLRMKIILTLSVVAIIYGPNHGERILTYMFVRYRLHWDAISYSIYSTFSVVIHSIGAFFSITVFSKRWGFHDSMLCLISVTSKLVGSIYIAFVYTDLQMFLVPLVEILNATTFTSLRSMASKLVEGDEMGKMNSLFSLVETLAALMFDPTYSLLYARTVSTFTATVYLFSAFMTLPAISTLIWFFVQHRRETKDRTAIIEKQEQKEKEAAAAENANTHL